MQSPLAGSRAEDQHRKPLRPASAQLEEVVKVREASGLQLLDKHAQRLGVVDGSQRDDVAFHAKLRIGKSQASVEHGTAEIRSLIGCSPKEERRNTLRNGKWHA